MRAALPRLVGSELRPAAAAVSTLLFEFPVLVGPLLLTAMLIVGTPEAAVVVGLLCSAAGACLFAASPYAGSMRTNKVSVRGAGRPSPARVPAVRQLAAIIAVQGFAVGSGQVAAVARATSLGSVGSTGLLYAALTAGSLLGTAAAGRRWGRRRQARPHSVPLLLLGLAGASGAGAASSTAPLLALSLLGFGLCAGPLALRCFVDVERFAPADAPTAAVTLLVAAGLASNSAGSAIAGWLIDTRGTAAPLVVALGTLLTASLATEIRSQRVRPAAKPPSRH